MHVWRSSELITADKLNELERCIIAESTPQTIVAGNTSYSLSNLTSDYVVASWRFSGNYTDNFPPANITINTSDGSYIASVSNLTEAGITMQPIFVRT